MNRAYKSHFYVTFFHTQHEIRKNKVPLQLNSPTPSFRIDLHTLENFEVSRFLLPSLCHVLNAYSSSFLANIKLVLEYSRSGNFAYKDIHQSNFCDNYFSSLQHTLYPNLRRYIHADLSTRKSWAVKKWQWPWVETIAVDCNYLVISRQQSIRHLHAHCSNSNYYILLTTKFFMYLMCNLIYLYYHTQGHWM